MVHFNPDSSIPDLTDKVAIVTGGNFGLGKETVLQISKHNPARVYLAARSKSKAQAAIEDIKRLTPKASIVFLELDLGSFDSIKAAAKEVNSNNSRLDLLINNAGVAACPEGLTKDGYELQFGTNHVGHALFTQLLLPLMESTARTPSSDVRVVFVSSSAEGMGPKEGYIFDKVKTPDGGVGTWVRYGQSKLANVHYARALSWEYPEIKFISVHPGAVRTNMVSGPKKSYPWIAWVFDVANRLVSVDVSKGALNQLWAAFSEEAKSGVFYYPVGVTGKDSIRATNDELCRKLWDWTVRELKVHI